MDNKVGDNVPTQKKLDQYLSEFQTLISGLSNFCVTLSPDERGATVKPPKGAADKVQLLADLATRYEITTRSAPIDGMLADLKLVSQLAPFEAQAARLAQLIADTLLQARSEYWSAFLQNYGALSREADHDPALAAELKDIRAFMQSAHGRRARGSAPAVPGGDGSTAAPASPSPTSASGSTGGGSPGGGGTAPPGSI